MTHRSRGARRRGLCPGALATGRAGRPWPRAVGRAGRRAPLTRGRLSAPQPRASAPGAPGAHASGLRCLRAAGCRAHAARGSPGYRERSNAAGAERSASRAAHGASRRAEPAAGERAGGRRKTRTGVTERDGGRAGRGKEGGAHPPKAAQVGHPSAPGIPHGDARGSPGEGLGWWAGRPPTAPRDLQGPGQESETRSGSVLRIRALQGPLACAQVAREGPRAAATPARRQAAESSLGQGCPWRVLLQSSTPTRPNPGLLAGLRDYRRVAVRHSTRGLDRGLRESAGALARAQRYPGRPDWGPPAVPVA